jgi:SWI/SNF-related matrix-associated actin-dependent regulator 1 of chromatin subfamily A
MQSGDRGEISTGDALVRVLDGGEWYGVPRKYVEIVGQIPQCRFSASGLPIVHRSVLVVLRQDDPTLPDLSPVVDQVERDRFDAATDKLGWKLRQYQHRGREFVRSRRGSILALQMRMGKTPTIVASHDMASGPLVVIAPLTTRHVWNDWFKRRWPDIEPVNVTGRKYDADLVTGAKIVFGHYDILSSWQSLAARLRPGTLVFDEGHVLSKPKSQRTQAALLISTFAQRVVMATGTPLWNKPAGLWPMLACLHPGGWGKFYDYATRYCSGRSGSHGFVHDEPSNIDEFQRRMSDVMLSLTWNDVADELPPTHHAIIDAPLTEGEAYEVELLAEQVRDASRIRTPIGELARFRRLVGHLKIQPTVNRVNELLDASEPVVVWTWHRDIAQQIAKRVNAQRGTEVAKAIDGNTPAKMREAAFDWFRQGAHVLVLTLGVGQVGIDLSHARHEVFAELEFTPATIAQAEMRTFSPQRSMYVEYVVLDHPIDRRLTEILVQKCQIAQRMGVPAAETAIDMLGTCFALNETADMDRLMAAVLEGVA